MPVQILTLKLDGVTAGDYLTWCQDPDPPALDFALRSISIDADPLGNTITAILEWTHAPLPGPAAAIAAGLPLSADAQVHRSLIDGPQAGPAATEPGPHSGRARAAGGRARANSAQCLPDMTRLDDAVRTAA